MSKRKAPRSREAAIREWHRERKNGKVSPRRLAAVRTAIEQSGCVEPMRAGYWASLAGFKKAAQIKPELKELVRDGVLTSELQARERKGSHPSVLYAKR
jgi:hypothetical protein